MMTSSTTTDDIITDHQTVSLELEAIFYPKFDNEGSSNNNTNTSLSSSSSSSIRTQILDRVGAAVCIKSSSSSSSSTNNQQHSSSFVQTLEVSIKHSGSLILWSGYDRFYSKNSVDNKYTLAAKWLLMQHFRLFVASPGDTTTAAATAAATAEELFAKCSEFIVSRRLTLAFECVCERLGHHGELPKRDYMVLTAVAELDTQRFWTTIEIVKFSHEFNLPCNDYWLFTTSSASREFFSKYDQSRETGRTDSVIDWLDKCSCEKIQGFYPHQTCQGDIIEGVVARLIIRDPSQWTQVKNVYQEKYSTYKIDVDSNEALSTKLRDLNISSLEDDLRRALGKADDPKFSKLQNFHLPNLLRSLRVRDDDVESNQLLELVEVIEILNLSVDYGCYSDNSHASTPSLCIIHVLHDKSFFKFAKQYNDPSKMNLFRGLVFRINSDSTKSRKSVFSSDERHLQASISKYESDNNRHLMLKLKFVPYMIRTMCIRPSLKLKDSKTHIIEHGRRQLKKWGVKTSFDYWSHFLECWSNYCIGEKQSNINESNYLHTVDKFVRAFESEKLVQEGADDIFRFTKIVYVSSATNCSLQQQRITEVIQRLFRLNIYPVNKLSLMPNGLFLTNVDDGTVGDVRKVLKNKGEEDVLTILLENLHLGEANDKEAKRLRGIHTSWLNTRTKVLDIDHDTKVESIVQVLNEIYNDAKPKNHNFQEKPPPRHAILFFPLIPGSGKSMWSSSYERDSEPVSDLILNKAKRIKLEESDIDSNKEAITFQSDKMKNKKKYWKTVHNYIESKGKSGSSTLQPSAIIICDKNCPPASWSQIENFTQTLKSSTFPVLPLGALASNRGVKFSQKFPFNIQYLAVCMLNVLKREKGTHPGGLDVGLCDTACMTVISFFFFYRRLDGENFVEKVSELSSSKYSEYRNVKTFNDILNGKVDENNYLIQSGVAFVPFMKLPLNSLPMELQNIIESAIELQEDLRSSKRGKDEEKKLLVEMEVRLRSALNQHEKFVNDLTVDKETSTINFEQVVSRINTYISEDPVSIPSVSINPQARVKLVSVDVSVDQIHKLVSKEASKNSALQRYISDTGITLKEECTSYTMEGEIVKETHVTMAHYSQISQAEIKRKYAMYEGAEMRLKVIGLFFDADNAALEIIDVVPVVSSTDQFPKPLNEFVHITIWYSTSSSAFASNKLLRKFEKGNAKRVIFESPFLLRGVLSFWPLE